jgi:hypothetical protein
MATDAQTTANRANARNSTGPVTEEGKMRSSQNSTSHGLTSEDVSIPAELADEFEALRDGLKADLNPETPLQVVFFNQALSAAWKQFCCDHAEAQLDTMVSRPGLDPLLDPTLEGTIRTIERARAQAAKLLRNAITELRKVQTEQQYRWASMPEDEGYVTAGLGVADWQTINAKMQNEAKARMDLYYQTTPSSPFTPPPAPVPSEVEAALAEVEADPSLNPMDYPVLVNYVREQRARQQQIEKTNPIGASTLAA